MCWAYVCAGRVHVNVRVRVRVRVRVHVRVRVRVHVRVRLSACLPVCLSVRVFVHLITTERADGGVLDLTQKDDIVKLHHLDSSTVRNIILLRT